MPLPPSAELIALARSVDARCRLTGEFTLRSGQLATEYFDKYLFESDPVLLRRVVEQLVPLVDAEVALLGGLELGGVPLATMLSALTGIPAIFVRKTAKEYGTRRQAEGGEVAGRRILLVEDVITTGGAVLAAAQELRAAGAQVDTVVCAIDRSEPAVAGEQNTLAAAGITVRSVLTKSLLDEVAGARYFEDYQPGWSQEFGPSLVTEADILRFAGEFDSQLIHTDLSFAETGPYNGLIASGWHTGSLGMREIAAHYLDPASSLGGPGIDELRWLRPVRPGDQLWTRISVAEAIPSRSKPDRGIVRSTVTMRNQDGEEVLTMTVLNLIRRRPAAPTS